MVADKVYGVKCREPECRISRRWLTLNTGRGYMDRHAEKYRGHRVDLIDLSQPGEPLVESCTYARHAYRDRPLPFDRDDRAYRRAIGCPDGPLPAAMGSMGQNPLRNTKLTDQANRTPYA